MSPEDLYQKAGEIILHCNPTGVTAENAAVFIEEVQTHIRSINRWDAPGYGTMGYGDGPLIDRLRQLKYQSEHVLSNFPMGVESLSFALEDFRHYLAENYPAAPPAEFDGEFL